jgi:DNA primase
VSKKYFSEDIITEIRSRADIVSLISEYVNLRKAGRSYVGLCPFHQEKTPSFSVDPDKQLFYCFGCGQGGNVFSFLMKIANMSFQETVEELAKRTGVRLPEARLSPLEQKRKAERDDIRKALSFALGRYREMLFSRQGVQALSYLEKRGLSRETIDLFQLGYAPPEWEFITAGSKKAGIDEKCLVKAGLAVERDQGSTGEGQRGRQRRGCYDRFRNRVIFPIWNANGDLVGFAGRAVGDDMPKYLNSSDTPLFHKGRELYALNLAKPGIRSKGKVCVMEGYMDVISMFQNGIDYAVAGMGTAFSREQARTLLLLCDDVVLSYDQDEAGKNAVRRCIDIFREAGGKTRVVTFEGAKDPDEYVAKYGASRFGELIDRAVPDIRFIYEEAAESNDISTVEGKLKIKDIMIPVLASLESEVESSAYTSEIWRDLDVRKESLDRDVELYRRRLQEASRYKKSENSNTTSYDNQSKSGIEKGPGAGREIALGRQRAEEGIIRALVEKPELAKMADAHLGDADFEDARCSLVYANLENSLVWMEDTAISNWIAELCAKFGPVDQPERVLIDCVKKLKEFRLAELREEMKRAQEARDERRLLTIISDYQKLLKQVKSTRGDDFSGFSGDFPGREEG